MFLNNFTYSQNSYGISIGANYEVGCQVFGNDDDPRFKEPIFIESIEDGVCIRVCEQSNVVYTLYGTSLFSNLNTQWNVVGGNINFQSNTTCDVTWGDSGIGSLSFTITSNNNIIIKTICFEKINRPQALFNVIPPIENSHNIMACVDQTLYFTNQSSPNGGTALVSPYFWDFGDGTYSTAFEPNHSYSTDGTYIVTLTVYNSCNCSSSYRRSVIVIKDKGFDIICPGVVCDGDRTTYSLPEEIQENCGHGFNWSVIGGVIKSINNVSGDVTIDWTEVVESGFGYLTFDPSECSLHCYIPTTLKIPVVQKKGTINGPTNICIKEQSIYKMPQWPTTDFRWEIIGNENGDLADVILSDQRNEVIIRPLVLGTLKLRCTYTNTLLDCGGSADLVINVDGSLPIVGNQYICKNSTGTYHTNNSIATNWTLRTETGTLVNTVNNVVNYSYTFNIAGDYLLTAGSPNTCGLEEFLITVVNIPTSVSANDIKVFANGIQNIASAIKVCPNAPYSYSVISPSPLYQYQWSVNNGTINGSNIGNQVSISFNGLAPAQITVVKKSINPAICNSAPTVITVPLQNIDTQIVSITNPNSNEVCSNSTVQYKVNFAGTNTIYNEGEIYQWSISNPNLGSIILGQGTNTISILWNNIAAVTPTSLYLTITKCTLTQTVNLPIQINPIPQIEIVATPSTVCGGSTVQFSIVSTNGITIPPNAVVNWNFGTGVVTGGINNLFTYTNTTASNIGKNVTAQLIGVCNGNSNTANVNITILPQPPATLSLSTSSNVFCDEQDIYAELVVASATQNATFKWYKNGVLIPGEILPNLIVNSTLGFGYYNFVATNSNGCSKSSNPISILQFCDEIIPCFIDPLPNITNNSTQSCGIINLQGTASQNPLSQSWTISGPNVSLIGYTQNVYNTTVAGVFHTFYVVNYLCQDNTIAPLTSLDNPVVVPYIPDVAYDAICAGNNTFTINLTDKSSFYAPVTNRSINYFYRQGTTGTFLPVTGTSFTTTTTGVYQIKIVIQGDYDSVTQPACEKIITTQPLIGVPNNSINITFPPNCYDTAVGFKLFSSLSISDSILWTFEPGTANEVTNTIPNPGRVFPTSGVKTIMVTVTNKYGCTRTFTTTITVPEKCFNGTIISTPANATVCQGSAINLQYVPNGDVCTPTQYIWMDGQTQIASTTTPSISVFTSGFYWVKVNTTLCKYETPDRVIPVINTLPSVQLIAPQAICEGDAATVTATTTATQLRWRVDNVAQPAFNNLSAIILNNLTLGTHSISVTAYSGTPGLPTTCFATNSQNIIVRKTPDTPVITQHIYCAGQDPAIPYYHVVLTATSSFNNVFTWSNGMQGSTITVTDGGPYQVRITNGGCNATAQTVVPKNPEDYIWIFPTGCYNLCNKDDGFGSLIGPRLPLHYWGWNIDDIVVNSGSDDFAEVQTVDETGSYTLTINTGACELESEPLNANVNLCKKCDIQDAHLISVEYNNTDNPFCSFIVKFQATSLNGFNATVTAPNDELFLDPSNIAIQAGTNVYITTAIPVGNFDGGQVLLEIKGFLQNGEPCYYQFYITLPSCNQENNSGGEFKTINPVETKTISIQLIPNPADEFVAINYKNVPQNTIFEVYDLLGKQLDTQLATETTGNLQLNTSHYAAGVYIVVAKNNGNIVRQEKLIIK